MNGTEDLYARSSDGLFNDLAAPKMGCIGMRFGRNVRREFTAQPADEDIVTPNPRLISEELLKRDKFKPATILNLLAAAWIRCSQSGFPNVHKKYADTDSEFSPSARLVPAQQLDNQKLRRNTNRW